MTEKDPKTIKVKLSHVGWVSVAGAIIYVLAKVFVAYTPTPLDDPLPDLAKGVILQYADAP